MNLAEEVATLLSALRADTMSLDEVADRLRRRSWPRSSWGESKIAFDREDWDVPEDDRAASTTWWRPTTAAS